MCGIAGVVAADGFSSSGSDRHMRAAIRYRGRDAEAEWSDGGHVRLFHTRLSIIALADGAQPMQDFNARYTIVYNGEIYNYLELREQYSRAGARFRTSSDTEVILEGFKLKGPAVCADLNGMFAFAIWDAQDRKLFLARDRMGKKPLFWTVIEGRFYFSSTLDAFSSIPGWTGALASPVLDLYARLGAFPNDLTIYRQARALPPACHAVVSPGRTEPAIKRYWQLRFEKTGSANIAVAADEYESLLTDAIRIRLRADVPVALTFSGGVDSGTIAALAKKRLGVGLACYTIDYHTAKDPSAETEIAESIARHLDLDWHHLQYDYRNDLFADLLGAYRAFDQPSSQVPLAYSQRLYDSIRPFAKVVLSGAGADELFTGYVGNERLRAKDRQRNLIRLIPSRIRGRLPPRLRSAIDSFHPAARDLARYQCDYLAGGLSGRSDDDPMKLQIETIFDDIVESGVDSHVELLMYMSLRFYGSEANYRLPDITGLRAQVEVRSPFLDYRLVEFAAKLPAHLKIGSSRDPISVKRLPRYVYGRYVPSDVAWSPKKAMGFNIRFDESFASDPRFEERANRALDRLDEGGFQSKSFRPAWAAFLRDKRAGIAAPASAGIAMAGVMLGLWLDRKPLAIDAAA